MRDFKSWFILLVFGLPVFLIVFIAALYFGSCGFSGDCSKAALAPIMHTPIPTLIPATLPVVASGGEEAGSTAKCTVSAQTLLAAWVSAGYSETEPFAFSDINGTPCEGTFADVQPLFAEANLWYAGSLACASCHNADVEAASAQMDMSSYAGILAGSKRTSPGATGNDILGGGSWDASKLNEQLFVLKKMPFGRTEGAVPDEGPTVLAGHPQAAQSQ
jgi:hypothetical protein